MARFVCFDSKDQSGAKERDQKGQKKEPKRNQKVSIGIKRDKKDKNGNKMGTKGTKRDQKDQKCDQNVIKMGLKRDLKGT